MKKLLAIFLLIATLAFMFSCGDEEKAPEKETTENEDLGDYDGNGTTDSLENGMPIVPIFPD